MFLCPRKMLQRSSCQSYRQVAVCVVSGRISVQGCLSQTTTLPKATDLPSIRSPRNSFDQRWQIGEDYLGQIRPRVARRCPVGALLLMVPRRRPPDQPQHMGMVAADVDPSARPFPLVRPTAPVAATAGILDSRNLPSARRVAQAQPRRQAHHVACHRTATSRRKWHQATSRPPQAAPRTRLRVACHTQLPELTQGQAHALAVAATAAVVPLHGTCPRP